MLSSREANRARRKARQLAGVKSQKSRDLEDPGTVSLYCIIILPMIIYLYVYSLNLN